MGRNQAFILGTALLLFLLVTTSQLEPVGQEEEGSFFEFAQTLLQESVRNQNTGSGVNILSGVIQGLMESDSGKQLGDMLTKGGNGGAVDLIANLASVWQASKTNPSLLSSMSELFSTMNKVSNDAENNNVDENNNDEQDVKKEEKRQEGGSVNWKAILSVAGTMMSSMSNAGQDLPGDLKLFPSFLPVVMRSIGGQHNQHSSHSIPHHTHSQFLPPFLENLHEYWDYFLQSEFGKGLWESSDLSDLVRRFTDEKGNVETDKIFQSLENNALRRRWIKGLSRFLAEWMKHLTNAEVQKSYLKTGQIVCNTYLRAYGYPEDSLLDLSNPAKSISALTDAIFKRHLDLSVSSEAYVGPAVAYIQDLVKSGHQTGFGLFKPSDDAEAKLTESMDSEVIEPVLRVHRAYKFALKRPGCAKYVFCTVNQGEQILKYGLKPAVTKASSFVASWFLSHNDTSVFWNLYTASTEDKSCSKYNNDNCADFHAEDLKATTEYYHNEL